MTDSSVILRAAGYAILASLLFASMGVAVRYSAAELPNEMVVFLRNSLGLVALMPWILRRYGLRRLATKRLLAHMFRAIAGLSAMYCFFYALAHLPLAEAVVLNFSSPLFVALIALLWLGERASPRLMLAILAGFAGVGLIMKPGSGVFSPAATIGLVSGFLGALAMVGIRKLSDTEPTHRIVFYFCLFSTLVSAVPLIWSWQTPSPLTLVVMAGAGLCATIAQLLLTKSYSLVPAARAGPYMYFTVLFAALLGWWLWAETPDLLSGTGALLICVAGILAARRDTAVRMV